MGDRYKEVECKMRRMRLEEIVACEFTGGSPKAPGYFDSRLRGVPPCERSQTPQVVAPGVTLLPQYLDTHQSILLAAATLLHGINPPYQSNLTRLDPHGNYMDLFFRNHSDFHRLRWVTQGHQYEWGSRTFDGYVPMPPYLAQLAMDAVSFAGEYGDTGGWDDEYRPDTSIINLYRRKDRLRGHVDDAEENLSAPLVAVSLGQSAVFLLGGYSRTDVPVPVYLQSGDVLVMSGTGRRRVHGVVSILPFHCEQKTTTASEFAGAEVYQPSKAVSWMQFLPPVAESQLRAAEEFLSSGRLNISVRQR